MGKQTVILTLSLTLLLLAGCKQDQLKPQQNKLPQPSESQSSSQPATQSAAGQQQPSQPSSAEDSSESAADKQPASAAPPDGSSTPSPASSDTSAGNPPNQDSSPSSGGAAMTRAERIAELEEELEGSMATYDGMILRERDYALSRANQRGSEDELEADGEGGLPYEEADLGAGGSNGMPATAGSDEQGDATASQPGSVAGGGSRPASPGSRRGEQQSEGAYPPPADIPDGSNDDVVARQIREAALNEPDPELREKLWEEYRKYKNQ